MCCVDSGMEDAQASGEPGPCPHTLACSSVGRAVAGISKSGVQGDLSGLLHSRDGPTPSSGLIRPCWHLSQLGGQHCLPGQVTVQGPLDKDREVEAQNWGTCRPVGARVKPR